MSFLFRYLRFHDIIGGIHVPVDDGVDKLNRKYTLLVFLFLALPIFTKQYIGDPIECFAPVYFAEHQSRYINSYCWTQSTYYMVPVGDPEDDGDQQEPPDRIMPDEVDYFVGFETVTHIGNERIRRVRVSYYQWAPLILLAQGLCFYIPFLIWNSCANNAGVKLRRLLKKASDIASLPPGCQQREALLAEFVDQFHTLVTGEAGWCADLQCGGAGAALMPGAGGSSTASSSSSSGQSVANGAQQSSGGGGGGGTRGARNAQQQQQQQHHHHQQQQQQQEERSERHSSSHHNQQQQPACCLVSIPIIGHLLACCLKPCPTFGLVVGQFLGRGYLRHGLELVNRLIINGEWWSSPRFPLSTLCQVRADMSGGLRSYTCQCVLPINVFNEKIFSVVWFYMAFLLPLNVLSLLFWIYRTFETNRISYIRLCLWRTRLVELNQIHRTVRRLSQSYLGWDGVFLLRLIEHNHGSIMATLIMSRLWEFYANQMKLQEDANQLVLANNAHNTLSSLTAGGNGGGGGGGGPIGGGGPHQQQPQSHGHHHAHAHSHGPGNVHAGHHHGPVALNGGHHAQQQFGQAGHHHHAHGHVGGVHAHPAAIAAAAHFGAPPLQPTQAGPQQFGGQPPPPPPLVPTGHHSGQISQAPGHHPLHAANTAAAHSHAMAHHAHAHAVMHAPHLSGASANLLAQLHQQQQQQQHQSAQSATTTTTNQQAAAAGNVAAAVAALAAAAAAATSHSQAPGNNPNSNTLLSTPTTTNSSTNTSNSNNQNQSNSNNNNNSSSNAASSAAAQSGINLHALKQNAAAAPNATSGGPPKTAPGSTSTTSFITQASAGAVQPGPGPPLPPPPPAHVVAAVAAAAGTTAAPLGQSPATTRPAAQGGPVAAATNGCGTPLVRAQQPSSLFNLKSSNMQQQQQHAPGVVSASAVSAQASRFAITAPNNTQANSTASSNSNNNQPSTNSSSNNGNSNKR